MQANGDPIRWRLATHCNGARRRRSFGSAQALLSFGRCELQSRLAGKPSKHSSSPASTSSNGGTRAASMCASSAVRGKAKIRSTRRPLWCEVTKHTMVVEGSAWQLSTMPNASVAKSAPSQRRRARIQTGLQGTHDGGHPGHHMVLCGLGSHNAQLATGNEALDGNARPRTDTRPEKTARTQRKCCVRERQRDVLRVLLGFPTTQR